LAALAALTAAAAPFAALAIFTAIAVAFAALAASAAFAAIAAAFAASTAFAARAAFAATAAAFATPAIMNGMKKGSSCSTSCCFSSSSFNSFISRTIASFCSTYRAAVSSSSFIIELSTTLSSISSWSTSFSGILIAKYNE